MPIAWAQDHVKNTKEGNHEEEKRSDTKNQGNDISSYTLSIFPKATLEAQQWQEALAASEQEHWDHQ